MVIIPCPVAVERPPRERKSCNGFGFIIRMISLNSYGHLLSAYGGTCHFRMCTVSFRMRKVNNAIAIHLSICPLQVHNESVVSFKMLRSIKKVRECRCSYYTALFYRERDLPCSWVCINKNRSGICRVNDPYRHPLHPFPGLQHPDELVTGEGGFSRISGVIGRDIAGNGISTRKRYG